MQRLRERTATLEDEARERAEAMLERPQTSTSPAATSPDWIDDIADDVSISQPKASIMDLLCGNVEVKSYNQRNKKD